MILLRHAWKELVAEPRFALLFLLNLSLGLSGLVTMEAYRSSLSSGLKENSRRILSADLALVSRRSLRAEEEEVADQATAGAEAQTQTTETFSMVAKGPVSRLVGLKAVGSGYPLRGFLDLRTKGRIGAGQATSLLGPDRLWLDPDLALQLGLKPGDSLTLGAATFTVDDLVSADPTQGFRALALGGKILLSLEGLSATGLLRPESTVTFTRLYRFPEGTDATALARAGNRGLRDPAVQFRSADEAAGDLGRMMQYLGDFLGLAALVALALSSLGAAFLFRTWIIRRAKVLALHQVMGLTFGKAVTIPALQSLLLAVGALPFALAFARLELLALSRLAAGLAPVPLQARIAPSSVPLLFLVAALGTLLLSIPLLAALRRQPAREILQGFSPEAKVTLSDLALWLPAALFLFGLSVYQAQSFRLAGIFFVSLMGSLAALGALGWVWLKAVGFAASSLPKARWTLRHALLHLSRKGFTSLAAYVALALGALLLNLLPQLRSSLLAEMENPQVLPSLFLFDIQDEQLAGLQGKVQGAGVQLDHLSPLVRARLLKVNGKSFERSAGETGAFQTREEETEARFRNRGFNLSYRNELTSAETLVAGQPFAGAAGPENEISLEVQFAERLKLKIGDELTFDVQGVEVSGRVVNLRKVKWTSFQPNFFVLFRDGVLNEAPKSYLASLRAPGRAAELQSLIARDFPNVSVVDVDATVKRVLSLADRLRWCLHLMSAVSLFAGFVVLFSIARRQAELRRWDLNLCRVLGASARDLNRQLLLETGLLSALAAITGGLLSLLMAWVTARYFFDGAFRADALPLVLAALGTCLTGVLVSWLGSQGLWRQKPAELLQDQG